MSLSILEQNLLNRELKHITQVITKAHTDIYNCLSKYSLKSNGSINIDSSEIKDYNDFIQNIVFNTFSSTYYAGYLLTPRRVNPANIPESLKKLILEKVTKDFIEKVEELRNLSLE